MITGTHFGHAIAFDEEKQRWEPVGTSPGVCPKCGLPPTAEGYDPCIGYIRGAVSVCCGHGAVNPYVVFPNVETLLKVCAQEADRD